MCALLLMVVLVGSAQPVPVDSVVVIRRGALEDAKAYSPTDRWLYRTLERLRWRSTDATVRGRLPFMKGDAPDSLALAETERRLRQELFLADARVRRLDTLNRNMIRVETWDQWSTSIPASIDRAGGELSWFFGVSEANLLGTGQRVAVFHMSQPRRDKQHAFYENTRLLHPRGRLRAEFTDATDGHVYSLMTGMPFLSTRLDRWELWAEAHHTRETRWLQADRADRKALEREGVRIDPRRELVLARAPDSRRGTFHLRVRHATGTHVRLLVGLGWEEIVDRPGAPRLQVSFDSVASASQATWQAELPTAPDERASRLGLFVGARREGYWVARNFQNLRWSEDIPTGWAGEVSAWHALREHPEASSEVLVRSTFRAAGHLGPLFGRLQASGRTGWAAIDGWRDGLASWTAEGRWFASSTVQLLGSALQTHHLARRSPWSQTTLGEEDGLPGWRARTLAGASRTLVTSELRWIPDVEAATVAPALAIQWGSGTTDDSPALWPHARWRHGVGIGLRFGLTRSLEGIVNHLTVSHAVGESDDPWLRARGWLVTFGSRASL